MEPGEAWFLERRILPPVITKFPASTKDSHWEHFESQIDRPVARVSANKVFHYVPDEDASDWEDEIQIPCQRDGSVLNPYDGFPKDFHEQTAEDNELESES